MDAASEVRKRLTDQEYRLNTLYCITDKDGNKVQFRMNSAQRHLFKNRHNYNVILKARQLGFSTFILIYFLDCCLFNDNLAAGVIAHTREDSESLFKNKVKFAYDNLPDWLKELVPATQDSARRLEFSNGSSISVGTSLRGGTFQRLHVSEYGKIAARYPEKAREIKTGALNTVSLNQEIFIESTAEGNQGEFYEVCQLAQRLAHEGTTLTPLDPKFFFYPWYLDKSYRMDADVVVTIEMNEYFDKMGVDLEPKQKAWYVKKAEQQGEDMKREFPSTPREAFEQSMEGAIYAKEMALVRKNGQIGFYPHEPSKQVYTFWDLGKGSDYTSIWFFQQVGNEYRFINYHESWNEGWEYYAKLLNSYPYVYAEHVLPHDGETTTAGKKMSNPKKDLQELGVRPIWVVPRTQDMWSDIKGACKATLPRCSFDKANCSEGVKHLDNYRKEWDDRLGQWKEKPRHDMASHACFTGETKVLTRIGTQRIMDLPETGEVKTKCGWKQYENPRITRRNARVVEVVFKSGYTVKCTQDHLFLTEKGWKSAKSLERGLLIQSSCHPLLNILISAYTSFGLVKNTLRGVVRGFIGMCGEMPLVRYQTVAISTTKTETQRTTYFKTLSAWMQRNTLSLHGKSATQTGRNTLHKTQEQKQQNGIDQRKVENGIVGMQLKQRGTKNGSGLIGRVITVALLSPWLFVNSILKDFVGKYARHVTVEKINDTNEVSDVWCLTVPDVGHFSLENGAIVKNCDAFRTFVMGYRGRQNELVDYDYKEVYADNDYDMFAL